MTGSAHLGEVRPDTRKRSGARLEIGDLGSHRRREARLLKSTLLCKVDLAGNSGGRDKLCLAEVYKLAVRPRGLALPDPRCTGHHILLKNTDLTRTAARQTAVLLCFKRYDLIFSVRNHLGDLLGVGPAKRQLRRYSVLPNALGVTKWSTVLPPSCGQPQ